MQDPAIVEQMNRSRFFEQIPAMPQAMRQLIIWAYAIAKVWHKDQLRDDGVRYFEHLRGVANILIHYGYIEPEYIVLAILHDILEDTYMPVLLLEQIFGHEIAREVLTVSKSYCLEDPRNGFMTRLPKREKEEYFFGIEHAGRRAALAKCADRIHNLSDLIDPPTDSRWTPQKRLSYVAETREWILPLALKFDSRLAEKLTHLCELIELKANAALAAQA